VCVCVRETIVVFTTLLFPLSSFMCILNVCVERVLALPTDCALHITDRLMRSSLSKGRCIPLPSPNKHKSSPLILINAATRRALGNLGSFCPKYLHLRARPASAVGLSETVSLLFFTASLRASRRSSEVKRQVSLKQLEAPLKYLAALLVLTVHCVVAEKKSEADCFQSRTADEACVAVRIEPSRGTQHPLHACLYLCL